MTDGMSRQTFDEASDTTKLGYLFDETQTIKNDVREIKNTINKKRKIDTAVTATFGFFGGMTTGLLFYLKTFIVGKG